MSKIRGEEAEDFVARRLREQGWKVEARNYRKRGFELDIIASRQDRLICIEVKSRRGLRQLHPALVMQFGKFGRLQEGMRHWLMQIRPEDERNVEFWLCSVLLPTSRNQVEWSRIDL